MYNIVQKGKTFVMFTGTLLQKINIQGTLYIKKKQLNYHDWPRKTLVLTFLQIGLNTKQKPYRTALLRSWSFLLAQL